MDQGNGGWWETILEVRVDSHATKWLARDSGMDMPAFSIGKSMAFKVLPSGRDALSSSSLMVDDRCRASGLAVGLMERSENGH